MLELEFQIESAEVVPYAAAPSLRLKTRIRRAPADVSIQSILLHCQVQIEPARRRYAAEEAEKLADLFGAPLRWGETLRPLLWANVDVVVPSFESEIVADIPLPCSFDFNVAVTKYAYGLQDGEIPVCALFSGTVFCREENGLSLAKIPWDREANYRLPVRIWKQMMDAHYPNTSWLCLRRDAFDQLYRYKTERGIPSWEQTLEKLLASAEEAEFRSAGL